MYWPISAASGMARNRWSQTGALWAWTNAADAAATSTETTARDRRKDVICMVGIIQKGSGIGDRGSVLTGGLPLLGQHRAEHSFGDLDLLLVAGRVDEGV